MGAARNFRDWGVHMKKSKRLIIFCTSFAAVHLAIAAYLLYGYPYRSASDSYWVLILLALLSSAGLWVYSYLLSSFLQKSGGGRAALRRALNLQFIPWVVLLSLLLGNMYFLASGLRLESFPFSLGVIADYGACCAVNYLCFRNKDRQN